MPAVVVGDRAVQPAGYKFIKAKQLKRWAKLPAARYTVLELRQVRPRSRDSPGAWRCGKYERNWFTLQHLVAGYRRRCALRRGSGLPTSTDPERESPNTMHDLWPNISRELILLPLFFLPKKKRIRGVIKNIAGFN